MEDTEPTPAALEPEVLPPISTVENVTPVVTNPGDSSTPGESPPNPARKKRGRKPGTKVLKLKNGQVVAVPPPPTTPDGLTVTTPQQAPTSRHARQIREAFRERLQVEQAWLWAQIKHLTQNATKEEAPRVVLLNKLIDKIVPDAAEKGGAGEAQPINIVINNLNRGVPVAR